MRLSCQSCHKEFVALRSTPPFVCGACQSRTRVPSSTKLGLHPALERRMAAQDSSQRTRKTRLDRSTHFDFKEMNLLPHIPGFDIAYQVGRGAMASVYRAREKKTGRLVAIKVLSQELAQRADLIARFEREACALKSLNCDNVVAVLDAGHVDDVHYFVMEFIDGITLRTRINRGPISLNEANFIMSGILKGLKDAHRHGIIHRDLKPENVLLAYNDSNFSILPDRVVVVDFGLVGIAGLAFDPHPNLTKSKVTMGTVNYMAPEQHVDAKRVDHRSDLYSAGVILFEMLTSDLPLGRYLMPQERGLALPAEIDAILGKSLARNPNQRYSSADQFLADLAAVESQEDANRAPNVLPYCDSGTRELQKLFFKTRYAWLVLVAGLFFAVGVRLSLSKSSTNISQKQALGVK
jgi:serine/threonine protein kinase